LEQSRHINVFTQQYLLYLASHRVLLPHLIQMNDAALSASCTFQIDCGQVIVALRAKTSLQSLLIDTLTQGNGPGLFLCTNTHHCGVEIAGPRFRSA
jgi:hypothetical protein